MRSLLVAALLATTLLAGCNGDTSGPTFETPAQDDHGRYVIEMLSNNRFSPKYAEVPAGATVIWMNKGGAHSVTADDGSFDSGIGVDEFERAFDATGEVPYHCTPHKSIGMTGILRVV